MRSPLMNYLTELTYANKGLPPKTMGLAHRKDAEEINLKYFSITEDYIEPFTNALRLNTKLLRLDLTQCNITRKMCHMIAGNLPESIERLDLTGNPLLSEDAEKKTVKFLC